MKIPEQKPCENLVIETTEDNQLVMRVDLSNLVGRTVKAGNPVACSTRGTKQILAIGEDGVMFDSKFRINCTIHKIGG